MIPIQTILNKIFDAATQRLKVDAKLSESSVPLETIMMKGTATGGTTSTIVVENNRNIEANILANKLVVLTIDTVEYFRKIVSNAADTITIGPILEAIAASATVTGGDGGSVTISLKEAGEDGNSVSVELVAGTGVSTPMTAAFANNILTISSATDGTGQPVEILAGNIDGLIGGIPELAALFDVDDNFSPGSLDLTAQPIPFTGGQDGIPVVAGTPYKIIG